MLAQADQNLPAETAALECLARLASTVPDMAGAAS
jgi:hypothetical protein